ncbi:MAG: branched-chain amino acid transaminase [bacterium]
MTSATTSFSDRDGEIWLDGEFVPWREAKVHVLTHTLHYGLGVFEGVRAYAADDGTAIFRLRDHTERLLRSAHILNMKIPYDVETLMAAQREAVKRNNLAAAYIRPMAFYGAEGMGIRADSLRVHVTIAAWEWGSYLGEENMRNGIRVRVSSYARHHVNVSMCRAKANGHYINSILALAEAVDTGYDEALLLDTDGFVMEGSGENLFVVRNGVVYTPELTSALDGITRDTVLQLLADDDLEVVQKRITRDEVYICDEAFFTGTAAEVTPIRELDNRRIGAGTRGPITERIQSRFFDAVYGRIPQHREWLTYV